MFYIALSSQHKPLITMGDAVASFLSRPDSTTKVKSLVSISDFKQKNSKAGPREWLNPRFRWKDATSKKHRITTVSLLVLAIVVVSSLLHVGILSLRKNGSPVNISALARLGYGSVDPRTTILWDQMKVGIYSAAFIANSPQVILSLLYFSYNALFTAMLLGHEWSSYAYKRKGLRVSSQSQGAQRSKYFLQLPYRFGAPLLVLSGVMHWLISQSIFVVAVDYYNAVGYPGGDDERFFPNATTFKTCGYSPIAIISVIIVGVFMVLAIIAVGFVPYKRGMPLAGSCSLAVSAACHPAEWEGKLHGDGTEQQNVAATGQLKWGVVSTGQDGIGHCSFSEGAVKAPEIGKKYA